MGKRKVVVAVLVLLGAGALLAAVAASIAVLIVARAMQGAGGAVLPLASVSSATSFPQTMARARSANQIRKRRHV